MSAWIFFTVTAIIYFGLNYALKTEKGWPGNTRFHDLISPKSGDSASSFYKLMVGGIVVIVVVFAMAVINLGDTKDMGTFGDFVGGVINPILTFFTFVGLLITIVLQQKAASSADLAAQKTEATLTEQLKSQKRQSFESTFFQMLNLHNTIVSSMDIRRFQREDGSTPSDIKGRDCFELFSKELREHYDLRINIPEIDRIQAAYQEFWSEWQQDLGHYFRYLYNVIRFIHESNVGHLRYMKLLRAQLSDYELLILFYNCLTPKGHNFKQFVENYSLFDNLPYELVFDPSHEAFYNPSARHDNLSKMANDDTLDSTATIGWRQ
ncbi:putative phage abortive infection protein [Mesorhizobium sp. B2-1-3]|uniref:putative phage abortive infection protein n=1 Tax=Mesorhizobium sp. B2-1-3 TaxID=2589972 RepID=UPI0015E413F2|nr:putative phage abortive infection protein [Mesorhizobium sp. B2-1-3]